MTRATLRASILSWGGLKNYFEKVPLRDRELVECGLRKQQLKGSVILFLGPGALKTAFLGLVQSSTIPNSTSGLLSCCNLREPSVHTPRLLKLGIPYLVRA